MNRLILLGNGFDLAHGLPTSYEDFIFNICKDEVLKRFHGYNRSFSFLDLKISNRQANTYSYVEGLNKYQKNELISLLKNENEYEIKIECSNSFAFDLVTENKGENWSDIETYFYKKLVNSLGIKNERVGITKTKDQTLEEIKKLNNEFEKVKLALEYYLTEYIEKEYTFKPQQKFVEALVGDKNTKSTLLLNFNYTKTADVYLPILQKNNPTQLINIHGKLNDDKKSPMIFGFGDEYDKLYKVLEEFNHGPLFEHIKSFGYFKSNNYQNMESFAESIFTEKQEEQPDKEDGFEIFIIGHSCGLSDRTLLKYLFEHENCKSIKIFHHQNKDENLDEDQQFFKSRNNYIKVTQEISRHFEDKAKMRHKIVPFNELDFCPQVSLEQKKKS